MKRITFIFIFSLIINQLIGQDIHFSEFNLFPLQTNPGQTGLFSGEERIALIYKNQWESFGAPYKTYAISIDGKIKKKKWKNGCLGIGLFIFNDKAGTSEWKATQASASISGMVVLNKHQIMSGGIQGGYSYQNIGNTDLRWGNQYDGMNYNPSLESEQINRNSFGYADFSTGLAWYYMKSAATLSSNDNIWFNAGVGFLHGNHPNIEFQNVTDEKFKSKFILTGCGHIGLKNTNFGLRPNLFYAHQGNFNEINIGLMFRYMVREESKYTGFIKTSAFSFGSYYRYRDAIIPAVFLEYDKYALGISYDITLSKLTSANNGRGGIEVFLQFINPSPFRKAGIINCPVFQ